MTIKHLSLINYKNFESEEYEFDDKFNCFTGNNGTGKTNILDAVYQLSFGKSYFNPLASQNIRHGSNFFLISGSYLVKDKTEKISCSLKKGQKKVIKRNGKEYDKLSEHIGKFPTVIISPMDRDLIIEGSEIRRKFIDKIISQSNNTYLFNLVQYNKTLSQRNALLKYFAANRTFDKETLEIYNIQLKDYGTIINKERKEFLQTFIPIFTKKQKIISNDNEEVSIIYKSHLNDKSWKDIFSETIERDKILQYTTGGIHKDDLKFQIGNHPIKKFGSQGQQKSFLIALKLAEFEFIKEQTQSKPILLLDDIFDKLDENRVEQLIQLVNGNDFGQIFISDTHFERTEKIIKQTKKSFKFFQL